VNRPVVLVCIFVQDVVKTRVKDSIFIYIISRSLLSSTKNDFSGGRERRAVTPHTTEKEDTTEQGVPEMNCIAKQSPQCRDGSARPSR
jgi:hypothetical protein